MSNLSRRSLFLVALFVLVIVTACSRKAPAPAAPPPPNRGLRPAPVPAAEQQPTQEPAPPPFEFPPDDPKAAEQKPAAEEQPAAAAGPPPRDYAGELKGLVGTPSGCLKPRAGAQSPREISVTVEAVVMESGMISRAYARAGDLDDDELACIRARLGTARMQSGVEGAPRTVTTSVSLVLQAGAQAVPAPGSDENAPGTQPPEGQQPEPGSAAPSGAEQAPTAQPAPEAPAPVYGQPEPPANNPE